MIRARDKAGRTGFTLIELLVVIAIIAILAGVGLYAYQPMQDKTAVNNAAMLLQTWLTTAKQRAMYDNAPRGLRLLKGTDYGKDEYHTQFVYIEPQDDEFPGPVYHVDYNASGVLAGSTDAKKIFSCAQSVTGNYLILNDGLPRAIWTYDSAKQWLYLKHDFPHEVPSGAKAFARVVNTTFTPRTGSEEILKLPKGTMVDRSALSSTHPLTAASGAVDIVFRPDGTVLTSPNSTIAIFWVCGAVLKSDGTCDNRQGQPGLVAVNAVTGNIAGYAADLGNKTNPAWQVQQ